MSDEEEIVDGEEEDTAPENPPIEQNENVEDFDSDLDGDADDGAYWPEDWRTAAAELYAAGDQKVFKQEMKRLERLRDPASIYGMYRELEARMSSGNLARVPDEDASDDELAAWRELTGVPPSADDYLEDLETYDNGDPIDVDDEETIEVLQMMHEFGTPKESAHAILNYMHEKQVEAEEAENEEDEEMHWEAQQALKAELGPSYKRTINNISQLFRYAPGGVDLANEQSLRNRLLSGRTSDGVKIGDDPDMVRFLAALSQEIDPIATVMDTTAASGRGIDERIAEINKYMREDRKGYSKDEAVQAEYRQLMDAKLRAEARKG